MIVLQILLVPCVVILLLIGTFVIGSTGIEHPGDPIQSDQPPARVNDPDPSQIANTKMTNNPILKIYKTR